ncbi:MAG: PEP-CTERM sorting domain-containing protein [Gemmatimonadales bacterium]|nr:PEP-CTERM sorting domain-containing protein [Gemmatimonadales bacterium]MDZ4388605.1 PEP-CTERM sorting domain-containing protein [Gemmatimonadales bacterium]
MAAQNLVANPGFETGELSAWTLGGAVDPMLTGVLASSSAQEGEYEFFSGPVETLGTLSQSVATTPGTSYLFSFWLDNTATESPNFFSVSWDTTTMSTLTDFREEGYQRYAFNVNATSNATPIEFTFRHDDAFWYLDNLSVTAVAGTDVVPEPGTMTLLATGLVALATQRRRRTIP